MAFSVGDVVASNLFGDGIVVAVKNDCYSYDSITVTFDSGEVRRFAPDGKYYSLSSADEDIYLVESAEDKEEVKQDAVNPSHYNVEGVQQPIEVMKKLMTKEQFEGFLWGNIIKYAHRYGRKGDKKETAGKIAQYAKWLQEVEE